MWLMMLFAWLIFKIFLSAGLIKIKEVEEKREVIEM
jgi:hypothetical protein